MKELTVFKPTHINFDDLDEVDKNYKIQYSEFLKKNKDIISNTKYAAIQTCYTDRLRNFKYYNKIKLNKNLIFADGSYVRPNYNGKIFEIFYGVVVFTTDNLENVLDLIDYLGELGYCGMCMLSSLMSIEWLELENGEICMYLEMDTESG